MSVAQRQWRWRGQYLRAFRIGASEPALGRRSPSSRCCAPHHPRHIRPYQHRLTARPSGRVVDSRCRTQQAEEDSDDERAKSSRLQTREPLPAARAGTDCDPTQPRWPRRSPPGLDAYPGRVQPGQKPGPGGRAAPCPLTPPPAGVGSRWPTASQPGSVARLGFAGPELQMRARSGPPGRVDLPQRLPDAPLGAGSEPR